MSWEQLLSIASEVLYEQEQEKTVACPNDGEPLRPGPDGGLYCPFDGWPAV